MYENVHSMNGFVQICDIMQCAKFKLNTRYTGY